MWLPPTKKWTRKIVSFSHKFSLHGWSSWDDSSLKRFNVILAISKALKIICCWFKSSAIGWMKASAGHNGCQWWRKLSMAILHSNKSLAGEAFRLWNCDAIITFVRKYKANFHQQHFRQHFTATIPWMGRPYWNAPLDSHRAVPRGGRRWRKRKSFPSNVFVASPRVANGFSFIPFIE